MRNRIRNINILVILLVSVFLIIPKDVSAINTVECDSDAAEFTCEYYLPESDILPSGTKEILLSTLGYPFGGHLIVLDGKATHYEMTFTYNICTDGKGGMKADIHTWNTGAYNLDIEKFLKNPEYFYDADTYEARCPYAYIRVNNNLGWFESSYIKIRKTKDNVNELCTACVIYGKDGYLKNYNGKPFITDPSSVPSESYDDCTAILGTEEYSLGWLIKKFLFYFKILIPVLILVLSTIEFVKAIIINDEDTMKKTQKRLIIRIIVAIILFLVPTIVDLLLDVFGLTAGRCQL